MAKAVASQLHYDGGDVLFLWVVGAGGHCCSSFLGLVSMQYSHSFLYLV